MVLTAATASTIYNLASSAVQQGHNSRFKALCLTLEGKARRPLAYPCLNGAIQMSVPGVQQQKTVSGCWSALHVTSPRTYKNVQKAEIHSTASLSTSSSSYYRPNGGRLRKRWRAWRRPRTRRRRQRRGGKDRLHSRSPSFQTSIGDGPSVELLAHL